MTSFRTVPPFRRNAAIVLSGAAATAVLWFVGLRELAWLGFFAAAVWWAVPAPAGNPGRAATRPAGTIPESLAVAAVPGLYDVVPTETTVEVRARKLRLWTVRADLRPVTGTILVRTPLAASEVRVTVPAAAFASGNSRRDLHVIGPQFFDAGRNPQLTYSSGAVRVLGGAAAESVGDLTVRGVLRPVTWRVTVVAWWPDRSTVRLRASTTIRRSDFGLDRYRWLVGDDVDVEVDLVATRRPASA